MIRIGILGYDPILNTLLQVISDIPGFTVSSFFTEYDHDALPIESCGLQRKASFNELLQDSDIIITLSSEQQQLRAVEKAIKYHKHIYVHRFNQFQTDYMQHLSKLCQETGVATMIHMEWMHHPITYGILPHLNQPQRIELHFDGLLDLNHDKLVAYPTLLNLTMLLYSLNNSYNHRTSVHRIIVAEQNSEALNLRFEYPHGCVADLMLDGVVEHQRKELKIYQKNTYLQADFYNSRLTLHHITPKAKPKTAGAKENVVNVERPTITLQQLPALIQFLLSVQNDETMPGGSIPDIYLAMKSTDRLAEKIACSELLVQ